MLVDVSDVVTGVADGSVFAGRHALVPPFVLQRPLEFGDNRRRLVLSESRPESFNRQWSLLSQRPSNASLEVGPDATHLRQCGGGSQSPWRSARVTA